MLSLQYLTLESLATGLVSASQSSPVTVEITIVTRRVVGGGLLVTRTDLKFSTGCPQKNCDSCSGIIFLGHPVFTNEAK